MKPKKMTEEIEFARLSQINDFINNIFSNPESIKTKAAKVILYRLIQLTLTDRNEECMKECRGMTIAFDVNKVKITMLAESISYPIEQIKEALRELNTKFLDVNDNCGYSFYRFVETVSIHKKGNSFLEFFMDGDIWRAVCNYSSCFGMEYLISNRDTLYSLDLDPKQEEQYLFVKSTLYQILDGASSNLYELAAKKIFLNDKLEEMFINFKFYEIAVKEGKMSLAEKENTIIKILRENFQIYFVPSNKN